MFKSIITSVPYRHLAFISHRESIFFLTGCFPDHLKISSLTPILKQGIKEERGITGRFLFCLHFSKIIENV